MPALVLVAVAVPLAAHEFWVTPTAWQLAPGAPAAIVAHVGGPFPSADSFTTPDRVQSVRLIGPGSDVAIAPPYRRDTDSLAADIVAPATPGTYVGVFVIKPRVGEKSGPIFEEHLKHQGLAGIAEYRRTHGETSKAVRERYSRYGKTLIRVGTNGDSTAATRPLGLKIELVPLVDPTALRAGDRLRVRLLLDRQPVAGALVGAIFPGAKVGPDEWPVTAITDAQGEVELTLSHAGPWLVRAVTMERREGESGAEAADWETYWASLTFQLTR